MANKIHDVHNAKNNLTVQCLACGDERISAFQCDCGKNFCRNCRPDSFERDEYGDAELVTCPNCGAKTLLV